MNIIASHSREIFSDYKTIKHHQQQMENVDTQSIVSQEGHDTPAERIIHIPILQQNEQGYRQQ